MTSLSSLYWLCLNQLWQGRILLLFLPRRGQFIILKPRGCPVATWAWLWSIVDYLVRIHYRQIQRWITAPRFVHFPIGSGPQESDLRPILLQTFWVYMSSNWQGLHLILITKVFQGRPIRHFTHQTALTEQCFDEIITNESEEVNYPWNNNNT